MNYPTDLSDLAYRAHEIAKKKGRWDHEILGTIPAPVYHIPSADPADGPKDVVNPSIWAEKIALIHSEVSEILEARRNGDEDLEAEEVADVIIRCLDYAQARRFNIAQQVFSKLAKIERKPAHSTRGRGRV